MREIYNLLAEPNPDDPLVTSIVCMIMSDWKYGIDIRMQAEQYRTDRKTFDKRAAEYVAKYAS